MTYPLMGISFSTKMRKTSSALLGSAGQANWMCCAQKAAMARMLPWTPLGNESYLLLLVVRNPVELGVAALLGKLGQSKDRLIIVWKSACWLRLT